MFLHSLVKEAPSYENGEWGSHLPTHTSCSQGEGFCGVCLLSLEEQASLSQDLAWFPLLHLSPKESISDFDSGHIKLGEFL